MLFDPVVQELALSVLDAARRSRAMIATAESCTGGLVAALLTDIPGSSDVFERGFITYSNRAKQELLGVPFDILEQHGAVSAETARAMVEGALARSAAQVAVAVTGVAGPGGGSAEKPIGLVYIAARRAGGAIVSRECRFGPRTRADIRADSARVALALLLERLDEAA